MIHEVPSNDNGEPSPLPNKKPEATRHPAIVPYNGIDCYYDPESDLYFPVDDVNKYDGWR